MFNILEEINHRPNPFEFYTASDLWTDEHTSRQMLAFHLNNKIDASSRNSAFIDKSVAWIVSHFNISDKASIADFGCGPGLYAIRLAQNGAKVTGIDFSSRSIQYAKETADKKHLSINYVNADYLEFDTGERFDLVIMIMCDFCALSPSQRGKMLSKFYTFLKPGGFVLLDVYSLKAFDQRQETAIYQVNLLDGFWSPNKYYGFLNTFKYEKERVVLDKYTIIEPDRTRTVYNWLQYYDPANLEGEFIKQGFKIVDLYANVAGSLFDPEVQEFAVVAQKG